jgi:hypothetical protein
MNNAPPTVPTHAPFNSVGIIIYHPEIESVISVRSINPSAPIPKFLSHNGFDQDVIINRKNVPAVINKDKIISVSVIFIKFQLHFLF